MTRAADEATPESLCPTGKCAKRPLSFTVLVLSERLVVRTLWALVWTETSGRPLNCIQPRVTLQTTLIGLLFHVMYISALTAERTDLTHCQLPPRLASTNCMRLCAVPTGCGC
jgi:hypothetical protein